MVVLLLQAIIIFTAIQYEPLTIFGEAYPDSALALGWCVVAAPLICIPAWFIYQLLVDGGWEVRAVQAVQRDLKAESV